ncbi:MAG: hypothetical protein LBG28_14520 [Tannerella sp.]|jgi:hypothetical protein|nr:hypothetical protein [Tannerella sp.]
MKKNGFPFAQQSPDEMERYDGSFRLLSWFPFWQVKWKTASIIRSYDRYDADIASFRAKRVQLLEWLSE